MPPTLTKAQEDKVLKEIGYSRAQLQRDIPVLRLWLREQIHLPACRLTETDEFLSCFLVGCKGSIETAKTKLDHYYSLRGKGDVFLNRDDRQYIENVCRHTALVELPTTTPDDCLICVTRLMEDDLESYSGMDVLKFALLVFETRLRHGGAVPGQIYYALDAKDYTVSHLMKTTPATFRSWFSFFQDAYPVRVKKILVANVPTVLATAINTLVLPFLNKKIKERFHLTSEPLERVFEYPELLPKDYAGGKQKSLVELRAEGKAELDKIRDIIPQLQEETVESKRPKLKNGISDPYFGLHGSIKTLVID